MCGIAGAVDLARGVDRAEVAPMVETMSCRGPDDEGLWLSQDEGRSRAALGHRRLAVIDVPGGRQPMTLERHGETLLSLTYSGEVYNFRELRGGAALGGPPVPHRRSDTEVVLRGLPESGATTWSTASTACTPSPIWDGRGRGARPRPRPDGRQAALLLPDAGRRAVRLRAQGDPGQPAGQARASTSTGCASCSLSRQDARARAVCRGHARGAARRDRARRRREGLPRAPLLAAGGHARTPTTCRPPSRTVRELLDDIVEPPARRRRAAVHAALRRPGLQRAHRAGGAGSSASDGGRSARSRSTSSATSDELRAPTSCAAPPTRRTSTRWPRTSAPTTATSCSTPTQLVDPETRASRSSPPGTCPIRIGDMDTSLYLLFKAIREHSTVALSGESADEVFGGYPGSTTPTRWAPTPSRGSAAGRPAARRRR